jgi:hypothetical protein
MTDWKSSLRADPTEFLLENGSPPLVYRLLSEVLSVPDTDLRLQNARRDVLAFPPAAKLARLQRKNGSWGGTIGMAGSSKPFLSTEFVLSMLFEYGWDRNAPQVKKAVKLLKTFLTEKRDLDLHEYQSQVKADDLRQKYYRWFLRIIATGLLMRAGCGDDEKALTTLLGLVERVGHFVDNPVSKHPTEGPAPRVTVFRREAFRDHYIFIPDLYLLYAFSQTPRLLDSDELKRRLKKICDYIVGDAYQALCPQLGLVKTARGTFPKRFGIELRGVDHYVKTGMLDYLLWVLECFARLGLVNRYPLLMGYVDWLIGQQEKDGRWNLPTKAFGHDERTSRLLRLEPDWRSPARRSADLTFRIVLILKLQWERQIRMLDRGEEAYPF